MQFLDKIMHNSTADQANLLQELLEQIADLQAKMKTLSDETKALKGKVVQLENDITALKTEAQKQPISGFDRENSGEMMRQNTGLNSGIASNMEFSVQSTGKQFLYFSAPTPSGYFSQPTDTPNEKSIYQLEIGVDGRSGEYEFINTPDSIATATISVSQFIKPACKIETQCPGLPKNVTTLVKGRAIKDGDDWKVSEKATIRLDR